MKVIEHIKQSNNSQNSSIIMPANLKMQHSETSKTGLAKPMQRLGVEPALQSNRLNTAKQPIQTGVKTGRNEPCPCGSGVKYKKCCGKV